MAVWHGAIEPDPELPCCFGDERSDSENPQAQGVELTVAQGARRETAQLVRELIGDRVQEEPQSVGPEAVAGPAPSGAQPSLRGSGVALLSRDRSPAKVVKPESDRRARRPEKYLDHSRVFKILRTSGGPLTLIAKTTNFLRQQYTHRQPRRMSGRAWCSEEEVPKIVKGFA